MDWTTNQFVCIKVERIWGNMLPSRVLGVDVVAVIRQINRSEAILFVSNAILRYVRNALNHTIVHHFCDNKMFFGNFFLKKM